MYPTDEDIWEAVMAEIEADRAGSLDQRVDRLGARIRETQGIEIITVSSAREDEEEEGSERSEQESGMDGRAVRYGLKIKP